MRSHDALTLALVTLVACAGTPAGPLSILREEGLAYTANLVEAGPEILIGTVTIANRDPVPRTIRFPDPCIAVFRFHRAGQFVWDQRPGNKTCVPPAVEITLQPGERREFERFAFAPAILSAYDLPSGRYELFLYLLPGDVEVVLAVGEVELLRPPPFHETRVQ